MLRCPPTRIELKYEDGRNELQWARTRAQRAENVQQQRGGGATTAATPTAATVSATTMASAAAAARERLGLAARTR